MTFGTFAPKAKPCGYSGCGSMFTPARPMQAVCSPLCARRLVVAGKKAETSRVKQRKEALETIPELLRLAQKAFNDFIRARDRIGGALCISSGRPLDWGGNGVDAGHYRSVGAASHLRFNENNCHAQSKHDNQYKSGNVVDYRINLIKRIGLEAVEALEADNTPHKWERDEIRTIRAKYKAKLKEIKP